MFATPVTNLPFQWPPAAPTYAWPGNPQYPPIYHQYHSPSTMPRKGASYRPNYEDPNQQSKTYGRDLNRPRPGQERKPRPPQQNQYTRPAHSVSKAKMSSLLGWLEYRNDTNKQTPVTNSATSHINSHSLYPASIPPPPAQYLSRFNPHAATFQPTQRSVDEYRCNESYRIDKHSRYNLRRRTDDQLHPYTTRATEQIVQSIEPRDHVAKPTSASASRWRGGRRQTTPLVRSPFQHETDRPVTPPPEPVVSRVYNARANALPQSLPRPQKLLVVLDLNGTLLARQKVADRWKIVKRPGVGNLLTYLFENHVVMVCTSATRRNAKDIVDKLLTDEQSNKLVAIRARDSFGLTQAQFGSKVQVYKNLEDVWKDPLVDNAIPKGAEPWSMANTVLIDDTMLKAKAQPHNLIQVPEFEWATISGTKSERNLIRAREEAIMRSVMEKLERLKYQANVASLIRQWQQGEKEAPGIVDEKVDQGRQVTLKDPDATALPTEAQDYLTPQSLESTPLSEAEYELPEQVELVFRGRNRIGQVDVLAPKGSKANSASEREYEPPEKVQPVSSGKQNTCESRRSLSPVTKEHFQWLKDK